MSLTADEIGFAIVIGAAAFVGAYLVSRRRSQRSRIRIGLMWAAALGLGQLARGALDPAPLEGTPAIVALVVLVVVGIAGLLILLSELLPDDPRASKNT